MASDPLLALNYSQAKRFKSLMKVKPRVKRIVGLTGTPSSNGLMDLFAEYKILDMGQRLGRFIGQYRSLYFKPDKTNGHIVYSYKLLPGAEDANYNRISYITISMKPADHLKMPELFNSRYTVHLVMGSVAAVFLFYRYKLKTPIEELELASQQIGQNNLDFHVTYENSDEMGGLCREFERIREQLAENNHQLWKTIEEEKALRAAIAHDIRSPLSVVKGYQDLTKGFLPVGGTVTLDGILYSEGNYEKIQRKIGYLPQEIDLYPNLTV